MSNYRCRDCARSFFAPSADYRDRAFRIHMTHTCPYVAVTPWVSVGRTGYYASLNRTWCAVKKPHPDHPRWWKYEVMTKVGHLPSASRCFLWYRGPKDISPYKIARSVEIHPPPYGGHGV